MAVTKKVRGYARCRAQARQMSNFRLSFELRVLRSDPKLTKEERVCKEAYEDEAVDRLVEAY